MPEGVFQTDRAIFDNPIWKNQAKFRLFFYIYGNAIFLREGFDIGGIHLERGQLLKSYRVLADDLEYIENNALKKYSISHIKKLIDELITEKRLKIEVVKLGTVFTVLNYEQYQGFERFGKDNSERSENAVRTQRERNENNNNKDKNVKNENKLKESSLSSNKFDDDSIQISLASELYNLILVNDPKAKKPNIQTWASDIDKIIRLDKRTAEEIKTLINWSQKDQFWKGNILSASTLRKQFGKMTIQMQTRDKPKTPNFGVDRTPKNGKYDNFYL